MRLAKLVSVLAAGLLLAGTALAQQRPGGFGGFGGFGGGGLAGMIGQSKQLQDELKMDKDQVDKLTEALAKVREDLRDETAKLRDRNTSEETRTEITKKVREANDKAVATVLQPEQLKRLHQIENQRAGVGMFAKEDVKKALKLSDEQNEKIKDINEDLQKDLRELAGGGRGGQGGRGGRGGFDPEAQQKRQAVQKEAMDNVVKVLNDEQKATLKDLTGAPFELRFEGFGAGGAGGFGGGFGGAPQAGQVLSTFTQERLKLTDDQKKQLEELQKDVDGKLEKILTEDQNKQLKEMRDAGRGTGGRTRGRRGNGNPPQ
jgi:hypothetical protein